MTDIHVKILDTTLRDGQQCPGAGMSFADNIQYAHLVHKLGVDILEAGFASASKTDKAIVATIAKELAPCDDSPTISSLCQTREALVDITLEALQPAIKYNKARFHLYLPVDPNLMVASLGSYAEDKNKILHDIYHMIKKAVASGTEVEFSPEGYSRMGDNFDFTTDVIRAAVSAGATIINCPDTIGGGHELQGDDYFVNKMNQHAAIIKKEFPDKEIHWSAHVHNDFGFALMNSINTVIKGPADHIEGCFNGIGERAGNVALEQCIMFFKHFGHLTTNGHRYYTKINTEMLQDVSDFVAAKMLPRQPHWPITGENAAKHTSGGHTNAILKNPLAYQPFDPAEVGKNISFIFGPLSGGNLAQTIIREQGYLCENHEKAEIAQFIKDLHKERRKGITDKEVLAAYIEYRKPIRVTRFDYSRAGDDNRLTLEGRFFDRIGRIDMSYCGEDSVLTVLKNEIDKHIPGLHIKKYKSGSKTEGINAISMSTIIVTDTNDDMYKGVGEDHNISISSLKALINAVNHLYVEKHYRL